MLLAIFLCALLYEMSFLECSFLLPYGADFCFEHEKLCKFRKLFTNIFLNRKNVLYDQKVIIVIYALETVCDPGYNLFKTIMF